jgi:adenylate cyclase
MAQRAGQDRSCMTEGRLAALAELTARLGRCGDLDTVIGLSLAALDELFEYSHSLLLMLDEAGEGLYTIASHGYEPAGVGSEVRLGQGVIGMVAAQCVPMRVGNLQRMLLYTRSVQRRQQQQTGGSASYEIMLPGLASAQSQAAAPMMALGELVGVLAVESAEPMDFDADDEAILSVVAHLIANAVQFDRVALRADADTGPEAVRDGEPSGPAAPAGRVTSVRFYPADGSTFIDGDYLIKGVAGRILWKLLRHHHDEGRTEFTTRELRLDPTLELPEYRDNLESRLILLKRRLEERGTPIRIEKEGRGRYRLSVDSGLAVELQPTTT